jgi:hypothetical protein
MLCNNLIFLRLLNLYSRNNKCRRFEVYRWVFFFFCNRTPLRLDIRAVLFGDNYTWIAA